MNLLYIPLAAFITTSSVAAPPELDLLEGDKRLACEALLCLSSPDRPSECKPAITKYFSIKHKKPHKTVSARKNFLKLCPQTDEGQEMANIIDTIANTSSCDAESLNEITKIITVQKCDNNKTRSNTDCETVRLKVIDNSLPSHCKAYVEAGYLSGLKYIGNANDGSGRWVMN